MPEKPHSTPTTFSRETLVPFGLVIALIVGVVSGVLAYGALRGTVNRIDRTQTHLIESVNANDENIEALRRSFVRLDERLKNIENDTQAIREALNIPDYE